MSKILNIQDFIQENTVLRHALIWTFIFVGYTFLLSFTGPYMNWIYINLVNLPLFMLAYYSLKHLQIPYLYNQGKVTLFVISLFGLAILLYGIYLLNWVVWLDAALDRDGDINFLLTIQSFLLKAIRFYSPALVILAWESHHEQRKEMDRMHELEKEKMTNELKFLKAQINPHFLFNTLNNLYSYVVTESPKAPDMILRLSGILDYVLYKSQQKTVPLKEELQTIEHFLGLEQIRYGERLEVDYKKEGNMSLPISPLILLSLVENAFKYGASGDIDSPKIKINIQEKNESIQCEIWNTKSKYEGELNDTYKEGIGLSNIKRQLNLIYPHQHELIIDDQENTFKISLTITPAT